MFLEKTVEGGIANGYSGIIIVTISINADDSWIPSAGWRYFRSTTVYGQHGVLPTHSASALGGVPEQVLQG